MRINSTSISPTNALSRRQFISRTGWLAGATAGLAALPNGQ